MNNRITELKKQAMVKVVSHGAYGESESYWHLDEDKFAELIVLDCLSIIERRKGWIDNENKNHTNQWVYGYEKAVDHCSMFIKEFYGVKE